MTVWKIYRYEDMVLAPTMVLTDDGVFVETQPVQACSIESLPDLLELIEDVLKSTAAKAQAEDLNDPNIPAADSKPVMLELLQIKRWKDFEKRALMYTLHRAGSKLTMHVTGRGSDGMWIVDNTKSRTFAVDDSLEEACRGIAAELVSRRPVESPRVLGLGMVPAPRDAD